MMGRALRTVTRSVRTHGMVAEVKRATTAATWCLPPPLLRPPLQVPRRCLRCAAAALRCGRSQPRRRTRCPPPAAEGRTAVTVPAASQALPLALSCRALPARHVSPRAKPHRRLLSMTEPNKAAQPHLVGPVSVQHVRLLHFALEASMHILHKVVRAHWRKKPRG